MSSRALRELEFEAPGAAWATPSRRRRSSHAGGASASPATKTRRGARSPSSTPPRPKNTAAVFGSGETAVPLEICVAVCPMVAAALKLSGFDREALAVGAVTLAFIATAVVKDFGPLSPAPPATSARARKHATDLDCMSVVPLPTAATRWFDAAAIVVGLGVCGLLCLALYVNDIDQIAEFMGGNSTAKQADYAEKGSCKLFLAGGPWPQEGVIDAFLIFHFIDNFLVMLAYRDFWLLWMWSPMCEICEASFQHVLPNFKECFWDSYFLDIFSFNAVGIYAAYVLLRKYECPQYDMVGLVNTRKSDKNGRVFAMLFHLILCASVMSAAFFIKHVTGIKETSNWFKLLAGTPMLLARDCSQGIVRRHYLGESDLPYIPFSGWVIILINSLEYYCLHTLVKPKSDWRKPAETDIVINSTNADSSLFPLPEGESESFLHALFFGAPWYTFTLWWPAIVVGVYLVAEQKIHPAVVAAGMTLAAGYLTVTRYSPVL